MFNNNVYSEFLTPIQFKYVLPLNNSFWYRSICENVAQRPEKDLPKLRKLHDNHRVEANVRVTIVFGFLSDCM